MVFISIGDIVVCTQLAFRLYTSLTSGRKKAPRDMQELEDVLFGLYCALSHLEKELGAILREPSARTECDMVQMKQQLERTIASCRRILTELDEATTSYRQAADDPAHTVPGPHYRIFGLGFSQQLKAQAKVQWQRVQWYLRSDSFNKYRLELQAHTAAINLLLNTMILSNTAHSVEIGRHQMQMLEEIEHRTTELDESMCELVQAITGSRTRHTALAPPALILPTRESQVAFLPITTWDQSTDVCPLALSASHRKQSATFGSSD